MNFITSDQELVGKTIKFIDAENYDATIIVTEDNGIFINDYENDYDGYIESKILDEIGLTNYILESLNLRKALTKNGILTDEDIAQFRKEKEERRLKEKQAAEQRQLESQRLQYEKLKKQFGE